MAKGEYRHKQSCRPTRAAGGAAATRLGGRLRAAAVGSVPVAISISGPASARAADDTCDRVAGKNRPAPSRSRSPSVTVPGATPRLFRAAAIRAAATATNSAWCASAIPCPSTCSLTRT